MARKRKAGQVWQSRRQYNAEIQPAVQAADRRAPHHIPRCQPQFHQNQVKKAMNGIAIMTPMMMLRRIRALRASYRGASNRVMLAIV